MFRLGNRDEPDGPSAGSLAEEPFTNEDHVWRMHCDTGQVKRGDR